ncbi:MAG: hypothetical protein ACOY82_19885 [Pseudomonadota bacterium]
MRIVLPTAMAALFLSLLSGCASHAPSAGKSPPPPPVAVAKNNRFEMTQNGQRMSADDFDRWMKARGIRIAKGAPAARKPRSDARAEATAKPAPKTPSRRR